MCVVDPSVGTSRKAIAMRTKNGMTFVGPDNGLFTFVAEKYGVHEIRELDNKSTTTGIPRPSMAETSSQLQLRIWQTVLSFPEWDLC